MRQKVKNHELGRILNEDVQSNPQYHHKNITRSNYISQGGTNKDVNDDYDDNDDDNDGNDGNDTAETSLPPSGGSQERWLSGETSSRWL